VRLNQYHSVGLSLMFQIQAVSKDTLLLIRNNQKVTIISLAKSCKKNLSWE